MEELNFNFYWPYVDCDKWPKNSLQCFRSLVGVSRMGQTLKFNSYGIISFDSTDTKHMKPKFTYNDSKKSNSAVFDLVKSDYNTTPEGEKYYDKCIVYVTLQANDVNIGFTGFVLLNTKTGQFLHRHILTNTTSDLFYAIQSAIMNARHNDELQRSLQEKYDKGILTHRKSEIWQ